jgi:hypothetical protein
MRVDHPNGGLRQIGHLATIPVMDRRLVRFGLIDPDVFRVEASDGTVWLHHVERDERGNPIRGQIDRWLNLLWAPPGMDAVLNDRGLHPGTICIPGSGSLG